MIKTVDSVNSFSCDSCGARLNVQNAVNNGIQCEFCGTPYQLNFSSTNTLLRAEEALSLSNWSEAESLFLQAASEAVDSSKKAAAFYGAALARHGVKYRVCENGGSVPVSNLKQSVSFTKDPHFIKAVQFANPEQKASFTKEGKLIESSAAGKKVNLFNIDFSSIFDSAFSDIDDVFDNTFSSTDNAGTQTVQNFWLKKQTLSVLITIITIIITLAVSLPFIISACRMTSGIRDWNIGGSQGGGGGSGSGGGQQTGPQPVAGAGEWRVGTGHAIAPGRYLLLQVGNIGGSVRLATAPGVTSHSQAGHLFLLNFDHRQYIDLEEGHFITISRAALFRLEDTPSINRYAAYFPAGQYLVGRDIRPGRYRAEQVGNIGGSFRIVTNPNATSHSAPGHISLTNFSGQRYVPVLEYGQFITISRGRLVYLD